MERIAVLREQAAVLRTLASSFDIDTIRRQLLDLAAQVDELARSMEENGRAVGLKPVGSPRTPM